MHGAWLQYIQELSNTSATVRMQERHFTPNTLFADTQQLTTHQYVVLLSADAYSNRMILQSIMTESR